MQYTNIKIHLLDYINLKKETNDYLIKENAKLNTLLQNNELFVDSLLLKNKRFNYIAAKVINNSIKKEIIL